MSSSLAPPSAPASLTPSAPPAPDPAFKRPAARAIIAIQFISVFFILIFLLFLVFVIFFTGPTKNLVYNCPIGQCPVNYNTSVKDCSRTNYDPSVEFCELPGFCRNSQFGCAIQPDGSSACPGAANAGVCGSVDGTVQNCGCSRFSLCASYIRSYFVPYKFNGVSYYGQHCPYLNIAGNLRYDQPLSSGYPSDGNQCTLGISALTTVANKTCLEGKLVQFTGPLYGCAAVSQTCPVGQHPVWNYTTNQADCQVVPDWPKFWLE